MYNLMLEKDKQIELNNEIVEKLERMLKVEPDGLRREKILFRIKNLRAQLAELCMTDEELQELIKTN
jgi:hypothetical protein